MRARSVFMASLRQRSTAALLPPFVHVDEVDDDQPGEVAQAQLTRHLLGRLEVGLIGRLLDVAALGGAPGVDVHRDQGLGRAEDDVATGAELDHRVVDILELGFEPVALEKWNAALPVGLHPSGMARDHHLHERLRRLVPFLAIDDHFLDISGIEVADRATDDVALFVDQAGCRRAEGRLADLVPQAHQEIVVPLELGLRPFRPRGAQDDRRARRHLQVLHD